MFRPRLEPLRHDPLVIDPEGRVVGVSTPPAAPPAETRASRAWRLRCNLARTGELRLQAAMRNSVSTFHVDPAYIPKG